MAEDDVVNSSIKKKRGCFESLKMHGAPVNGLIHDKNETISRLLDKNGKHLNNGCELMPKTLNGFYNHKNTSPVGEAISTPSLRSSPVRIKTKSLDNLDNVKKEISDKRLSESVSEEGGISCKWMDCIYVASHTAELASHAQEHHVEPMKCCDVFVCLWQDCKVFNRPSCSMTWLTKHLESHIGVKPFKCMIDGCPLSFSSQTGLARHVPCHFEDEAKPVKRIASTGKDESPSKRNLKRKRLKYIRYKKANAHARTEDFVDQHAIDSIKTRLADITVTNRDQLGIDGSKIHFKSQALGRRINKHGKVEILLHWIPESILPDEWISSEEKNKHLRRTVCIHSLPNEIKANLHPSLYRRFSHRKERRK